MALRFLPELELLSQLLNLSCLPLNQNNLLFLALLQIPRETLVLPTPQATLFALLRALLPHQIQRRRLFVVLVFQFLVFGFEPGNTRFEASLELVTEFWLVNLGLA